MIRNLRTNKFDGTKNKDTYDDLLVFGYHCKLFRNDEGALNTDLGRHLIPWAGDSSVTIDRYDGRGHLQDLVGYDADRFKQGWDCLTDEEKHMESLIDEERYLDLRTDVQEQLYYEEEEMKRFAENKPGSFSAIGYTYAEATNSTEPALDETKESQPTERETDSPSESSEPYTPQPSYFLPSSMQLPESEKVHRIIERTASFIVAKGIQMEIVMKTKQQHNPHFSFLHYDHPLHPYYKHFVAIISERRYIPASHSTSLPQEDKQKQEELEKPLSSHEFLESVKLKLPSNQIANTSYALLLEKLKKHVPKPAPPQPPPPQPPPPQPPPPQLPTATSQAAATATTLATTEPTQVTPQAPAATAQQHLPPPPDVKLIIDKLAASVARVGIEFETVLKQHKDSRFAFLDPCHKWNSYYVSKKDTLLKQKESSVQSADTPGKTPTKTTKTVTTSATSTTTTSTTNTTINGDTEQGKEEKEEKNLKKSSSLTEVKKDNPEIAKVISFSIKKSKEEASAATLKKSFSTLLNYQSDEEDEEEEEGGGECEMKEEEDEEGKGRIPHSQSTSGVVDVQEERRKKVEKFVSLLRKNLSSSDTKHLGSSPNKAHTPDLATQAPASEGDKEEKVLFQVGAQPEEGGKDDGDGAGGCNDDKHDRKKKKKKKHKSDSPDRHKHHKRHRSRSRSRKNSPRSRGHESRSKRKSPPGVESSRKKRSRSREISDDDHKKKSFKKHKRKHRDDDDDDDDDDGGDHAKVAKKERSKSPSHEEKLPHKKKKHHHHRHHHHSSKHSKRKKSEEVVDLTID